jgi:hypothetical protein
VHAALASGGLSAWPGKLLSWWYSSPATLKPREMAINPIGETPKGVYNLWAYRRIADRKNFAPGTYAGDVTLVNWPQNDYLLGHLYSDMTSDDTAHHATRWRELSRCLFYWIDYPALEKEQRIVAARVPGASELLSHQVVAFVQELRKLDLYKLPGVAETLDWTSALVALDTHALTVDSVEDTLGAILKYQDDINQLRGGGVRSLIEKVTR